MKKVFTHTAVQVGADARTSKDYRKTVELRETANYWVDVFGNKYSKTGFVGIGVGKYPYYCLIPETIKPKSVSV